MKFGLRNRMIKRIDTILRVLTILFGIISVMRDKLSFCNISYKKVTLRVCQQFFGKNLVKTANNIWVLGKNNFYKQEYLSVASDTGKYSLLATSDCEQNGSCPALALKRFVSLAV
jgi:hypothetical protein